MDNFEHDIRKKYSELKHCNKCNRDLPRDCFTIENKKKDKLRAHCKECSREAKHNWYLAHKNETRSSMQIRRDKIKEYLIEKKSNPCIDCNEFFHYSLMDFDHIDSDNKSGSVSQIASKTMSIDKIQLEINKCELVCCMCHRIRTWNRNNPENKI